MTQPYHVDRKRYDMKTKFLWTLGEAKSRSRYILKKASGKIAKAFEQKLEQLLIKLYSSRAIHSDESRLRLASHLDCIRYSKSAWINAQGVYPGREKNYKNPENLSAIITMEYHRIEKSLSMPMQKKGSGQDAVVRLIWALQHQLEESGISPEGRISLKVLETYLKETPLSLLNDQTLALLTCYEEIKREYAKYELPLKNVGRIRIDSKELFRKSNLENRLFLQTRHSIRDFKDDPVDEALIKNICSLAMTAPSVCNRQAWKLYAFTNKKHILELLALQNGNRGFADRIPLLFIVAADLRRFVSVEERNQPWVDGGLFAMNLMLSLHSYGLGSCPLNWCASLLNDDRLRSLLNIPNHEVILMYVAAGYLPRELAVTESPRRSVESILSINPPLHLSESIKSSTPY
jgi:nitroreductase